MAVHRYWRVNSLEAYAAGALALSELQLFSETTRVDSTATLSSSVAPATGSLANLKDDNLSTDATWPSAKGLVLAWDFGAGGEVDVTNILLGAADGRTMFPLTANLQWSDDGTAWVDRYSIPFIGIKWPGPRAKTANTTRTISGKLRFDKNWSDQSIAGETVYSTGSSVFHGIANGFRLQLGPGSVTDVRVRFDAMPSMTDVDITAVINLQGEPSVVFRTSYWGNANDTYGYTAGVGAGNVYIGRGSNSSTGSYTQIAVAAHGLTGSGDLTLRVTMTGSAYKVYVNGVLKLSGTDTTYSAAGEVGVRSYNATSFFNSLQVRDAEETHPLIVLEAAAARWPQSIAIASLAAMPAYPGASSRAERLRDRPNYLFDPKARARLRGTTKDKGTPNVPVAERVRLYRERDGMMLREVWSTPGTGAYSFDYIEETETYTVISYDHNGSFRAVVADGLTLANGGVELIA